MPKVSIVIPLYNMEKYIFECVQSALGQTLQDIEVIVVNDGSTDRSLDAIEQLTDRIILINQQNKGIGFALNAGIKAANGEYICWMGADDVLMPQKTEIQLDMMEQNKTWGLTYTDFIIIDSEGKEIRKVTCPSPDQKQFPLRLLLGNFINGSSVMIRREFYDKYGCYDESLKASLDGDMWFRLLHKGCKFGHIAQYLIKYRWHQTNISHNQNLMRTETDKVHLRAFCSFHNEGFFSCSDDYDQIASAFTKQKSFSAAFYAAQTSYKKHPSFRRFIYRMMCYMRRL